MLGLVLLYVGAVLFINGVTLLGRIAPAEAAVMNLLAGALALFVSLHQIASGNAALLSVGAFGLLFAFTYLWTAYAHLTRQDRRGLGWFSLFVAATATPIAFDQWFAARSPLEYWIAACWGAWALLWLCYFVLDALRRSRWSRPVAWFTIAQAVLTGWLPGYLMLSGRLPATLP